MGTYRVALALLLGIVSSAYAEDIVPIDCALAYSENYLKQPIGKRVNRFDFTNLTANTFDIDGITYVLKDIDQFIPIRRLDEGRDFLERTLDDAHAVFILRSPGESSRKVDLCLEPWDAGDEAVLYSVYAVAAGEVRPSMMSGPLVRDAAREAELGARGMWMIPD